MRRGESPSNQWHPDPRAGKLEPEDAVKPAVFATRLSPSERKPLALVLEKFQKTEQAAFLDPCGQTFSSLLQASEFLIGNKK
jgi:hypothetical protein